MKVIRSADHQQLGTQAGKAAAELIRNAITAKGHANIILATGTSQFETLRQLIEENIDWSKVNMFHLDEYIDLPEQHPASFRKYLKERFLQKVTPLNNAFLVNGEAEPAAECVRLGKLIQDHPIDVALVGVGENGHLAFNDPPADFNTRQPYIVVNLDTDCRKQQMNEGWFASIDEVPAQAISMSVYQIMQAKHIICSVPGKRKALAVKNSLEQPVDNRYPASILQSHENCIFYLDPESAAGLSAHN
ncbi:glucosamine-6-phosphate deaminase [Chitinophaga pendula]|uniref:glucosamine-6-phosphate deaminase n=1 Tax=Chitinophaga TaxID=79328 RepID=UPI000BAF30D1|nr:MULTISPECIES: glucosamine-6-phosphate deaminase [Chitinophaga]ASZ14076.1 glucosamine-6-phosphate deaminase [Chitinophaga sp. MD30]UCJ08292.1 glucosamine-6-phosphate deaminase [Chitinophaga pendula]